MTVPEVKTLTASPVDVGQKILAPVGETVDLAAYVDKSRFQEVRFRKVDPNAPGSVNALTGAYTVPVGTVVNGPEQKVIMEVSSATDPQVTPATFDVFLRRRVVISQRQVNVSIRTAHQFAAKVDGDPQPNGPQATYDITWSIKDGTRFIDNGVAKWAGATGGTITEAGGLYTAPTTANIANTPDIIIATSNTDRGRTDPPAADQAVVTIVTGGTSFEIQ